MCIYCSGTNKFLYHFHLSSASIRSSYNHHFDYSTTIMQLGVSMPPPLLIKMVDMGSLTSPGITVHDVHMKVRQALMSPNMKSLERTGE